MLTGYLAAFVYLLCLTAGIFLFAFAARRTAATTITFLEVVLGLAFITLLLLFQQNLRIAELFAKPTAKNWTYLGLAAVSGFAGGNYFSLKNLRWGSETLNGLLSPAITAAVVLFSLLFDSTSISLPQAAGIVLTLGTVVGFLVFNKGKHIAVVNHRKALWSGIATIICITANIVFSIKGAISGSISIFYALWLRLLLALPFVCGLLLFEKNKSLTLASNIWLVLLSAVFLQTIAGNYLWFVASFKIGIPVFQTLIATLPLLIYAVDGLVLKKASFSLSFLSAAVLALAGVLLLML